MSKRAIFGRSKGVERKIDAFLDKVSESALVFVANLKHTLETGLVGVDDESTRRIEQMLEIKRGSSGLRREVETELYSEMLVPDLLGDVAGLIEALHHLVEDMHHAMAFGRYARIGAPEVLRAEAIELSLAVGNAVEELVHASRAFFRDFTHVRDYVHKVAYYESEADVMRDRLLDRLYETDLGLAEKDHFARAIRELDEIADRAERIADMLTIYAIKRAE